MHHPMWEKIYKTFLKLKKFQYRLVTIHNNKSLNVMLSVKIMSLLFKVKYFRDRVCRQKKGLCNKSNQK